MLTDIFHANRWDYVFRFSKGFKEPEKRKLVIYFDAAGKVERWDADLPAPPDPPTGKASAPEPAAQAAPPGDKPAAPPPNVASPESSPARFASPATPARARPGPAGILPPTPASIDSTVGK